ncbi:MAG: hypothetical protein JST79_06535 [Acidobacteria bacterium]|nr:hypothetical protein [Acidobacteriota bacterium]
MIPREHSSGQERQKLGGISQQGNRYVPMMRLILRQTTHCRVSFSLNGNRF